MQENYTRAKPVDKERLADYLEKAKGLGRTMKQFAEECGVNPSTFSRIANKKIGGASTEAVIRSIFEHRDPASGITLDMLMDANGFVPESVVKQMREANEKQYAALQETDRHLVDETYRKRGMPTTYDSALEKEALEIIKAGIVMRLPDAVGVLQQRIPISKDRVYIPDMLVRSDKIGGNGLWAFEVMSPMKPIDSFLGRFMQYAMTAYFFPDKVPQRITFVVNDISFFQCILSKLSEQKFHSYVSLVLIDTKEGKIIDESVFPRQDGGITEDFFTAPLPTYADNNMSKPIDIDEIPF